MELPHFGWGSISGLSKFPGQGGLCWSFGGWSWVSSLWSVQLSSIVKVHGILFVNLNCRTNRKYDMMFHTAMQNFATDEPVIPFVIQYGPQKGAVRVIMVFINFSEAFVL